MNTDVTVLQVKTISRQAAKNAKGSQRLFLTYICGYRFRFFFAFLAALRDIGLSL